MSHWNKLTKEQQDQEIREALRRPSNFGYHGEFPEMFKTWSYGPSIRHRDSGTIDRSNALVMVREALSDGFVEGQDFSVESANCWAYGWREHFAFNTVTMMEWVHNWFATLADYIIADEDHHSELEFEEGCDNGDCGYCNECCRVTLTASVANTRYLSRSLPTMSASRNAPKIWANRPI